MITKHINITGGAYLTGKVYCYKHDKVIDYTQEYLETFCSKCEYFTGDSMGEGVECSFKDGTNLDSVVFDSADDSEKWCKYIGVRLGIISPEEADELCTLYSNMSLKNLSLPKEVLEKYA